MTRDGGRSGGNCHCNSERTTDKKNTTHVVFEHVCPHVEVHEERCMMTEACHDVVLDKGPSGSEWMGVWGQMHSIFFKFIGSSFTRVQHA
jgi:hypothetical protein